MNAKTDFSRRTVSISLLSVVGIGLIPVASTSAGAVQLPLVRISRDASCGCCALWADHLQGAGFPVEIINRRDLPSLKTKLGIPGDLFSCHTAEVGGYVIEGHVPASAIVRLLENKESERGLAVPRMPVGSPGTESDDPKRWPVYDVIAYGTFGRRVFARYRGPTRIARA